MTEELEVALRGLLRGEIACLPAVEAASQNDLLAAVTRPKTLVAAVDVARVLRDYRDGRISKSATQRWAFFIRHGFVAASAEFPITPLDIGYPAQDEDAVVEALMRLEELGDIIDGDLLPGEADQLLLALNSN